MESLEKNLLNCFYLSLFLNVHYYYLGKTLLLVSLKNLATLPSTLQISIYKRNKLKKKIKGTNKCTPYLYKASLVAQTVKHLPTMWET